MRLQFSLRGFLCVMLVMALLSVWQRDRAAHFVSAIAAAWRRSGRSRQHDEEARADALDGVPLAMRERRLKRFERMPGSRPQGRPRARGRT